MKLKNKLIGVFIVLVSIISIRVVKAESLPIGEYQYNGENLSYGMYLALVNETEMIIISQNYNDTNADYTEYTKGTYTIKGNKLNYSREYVMGGTPGNMDWQTCIANDGFCHSIPIYFPQNEEFIIDFNNKTISSSTYLKDYMQIDSSNLVLNYNTIEEDAIYREFVEKLESNLKDMYKPFENVNLDISSVDELTQKILIIQINNENMAYSVEFLYKNGILNYTINPDYLDENGDLKNYENSFTDEFILVCILDAFADIKGYDSTNLSNWASSITPEQAENFVVEKDGINFKSKKIPTNDKGFSGEFITEFHLDLVNGIKAYDPNVTYSPSDNNIFDEVKKNQDKVTDQLDKKEDKSIPNNPGTGSFIPITIIGVAGLISTVIFYFSKKKNKLFKI